MEKTFFDFCSVKFEIDSDDELKDHSDIFKISCDNPDVKAEIFKVDSFENIRGKYLGKDEQRQAYINNDEIIRLTKDICKAQPHIKMVYNPKDLKNIKAYVKSDEWQWASIEKYLWTGLCLNQIMLYFNTLFFHASYIDVNGEGIIFTAPSQTGKSTQANLWCKYKNAKIINGDKAAVRIGNIVTVNSIPFSGTSGICENKTLPLKAIVYLSKADENTVKKMGASEAVKALCPNIFADKLVSEEWSKTLNLLLDLISKVPIYHLACTPDERAVKTLEKIIYN